MKQTTVQNRRLSQRTEKQQQQQQQERESMSLIKVFMRRTWKGGRRRPLVASPCSPLSLSSSSSLVLLAEEEEEEKSSRRWDDDDGKEIRRGKRFGTFASKGEEGFERMTTRKTTKTTTERGEDIDYSETKTKRRFFSAYADVFGKNHRRRRHPTQMVKWWMRQKSKYENILVPDPFSLVQKELQFIADRMRVAVQTDLPALANAAEYFFKYGAEGKRMRPTVLLLMASALSPVSNSGDVVRGGEDVGRRMSSGDAFSSSSFRSSRNSAEEETVDLSPAHEVP